MVYVYILKSLKDKKIYTGYTADLRRRLLEHQDGKVKSTKKRLPLNLIYYEAYASKKDALAREKYLKSGGKAKNVLKLQLKNSLNP
ncbi:excinuclease ABC subunit C [Candidatus Shapirobacteria bacterium CG09_land_8_20_14_0_10_49_15]|uniref:Excinuclease ABC subunit C n=2 Tax=Candidatus Shapironibacteriota TaxID=1752721 RepID=A0A2M8L785_9BACT|nr:MAG: excinuclease ABC subunit C [Candidatus Shapirobacteria bacterium CG09_land_8_20_14_0_10_49_15]PJE70082.1 MAG: excinuclease ABC subunit C [Candidatus Shapirobacteria bacterium CG10_big_fil_rev_8_21_14_0_10_48_15]